jgi:hypothetical protein
MIPNITDSYGLIRFALILHTLHSEVVDGVVEDFDDRAEAIDRCKRWMDAVLPPRKAAE